MADEVIMERKFVVESMIVRIMKARKILKHSDLIQQVTALAATRHFVPDTVLIK